MSSPFPSADKELAELERFLAAEPPAEHADETAYVELLRRAERVALRIANPVRVAVVGLPDAGKSLLTSFLVGQEFGEARSIIGTPLPVILRYGERPEAFASWWSGIDVPLLGLDISVAADHNPDFVELRLTNPVLKFLSFLDMPGCSTWESQKEQVRWVASRADILIWCAEASAGWTDDERQLWALVPKRLQAQSLLAMTRKGEAPADALLGPLGETEVVGAQSQFHAVIGIAAEAALAASPNGRVIDSDAWDAAGGKSLVGALLSVARLARRNDIILAREILARLANPEPEPEPEAAPEPEVSGPAGIIPSRPKARTRDFLEFDAQLLAAAEGEETPPDNADEAADATETEIAPATAAAAAAVKAAPKAPAKPAAMSPLLSQLVEGLEGLAKYANNSTAFKDWEFMAKVTEVCEKLSEATSTRGALKEESDWVAREVEDAFIALSLMQLEQGEQPCRDAATVLLQLARDLAWAAAGAAAEAA